MLLYGWIRESTINLFCKPNNKGGKWIGKKLRYSVFPKYLVDHGLFSDTSLPVKLVFIKINRIKGCLWLLVDLHMKIFDYISFLTLHVLVIEENPSISRLQMCFWQHQSWKMLRFLGPYIVNCSG